MDVIYRHAREEDYEAVVNIDTNVHQGLDYLPARYHFYLSSPNHYPLVAEKNGEIAAFYYLYLVDDGTAVSIGSARLRADLRQDGRLTHAFKVYGQNEMVRLHPRAAHRQLYTAGQSPLQKNLIKNGRIKVLIHRDFKFYVTTKDSVQRRLQAFRYNMLARKYNVDQVTTPDKDEFVKLIMASPELFPGDCFVASWEPYRPMVSNFKYVAEHLICHVTPSEQGNKASAVSFIFHVPCKAGLHFDMEFYGTDTNHLIQHFLKSLEYLSNLSYEGDVQFIAHYSLDMDSRQFQNVINIDFKWKTGANASIYQTYIAAEFIEKNDAKL